MFDKQKRQNDQTVVPPGGGTVEDNGHPDQSIWGESSLHQTRGAPVRRFQAFTMAWPWAWTPEQVETWSGSGGWAHSTIRSYQGALAVFLDYVCDTRYGWLAECEQRVGARPVQVCHEWNTAAHVADYEGRPERRPLTRVELQAFLDAAD